jgi:hypothetical protein
MQSSEKQYTEIKKVTVQLLKDNFKLKNDLKDLSTKYLMLTKNINLQTEELNKIKEFKVKLEKENIAEKFYINVPKDVEFKNIEDIFLKGAKKVEPENIAKIGVFEGKKIEESSIIKTSDIKDQQVGFLEYDDLKEDVYIKSNSVDKINNKEAPLKSLEENIPPTKLVNEMKTPLEVPSKINEVVVEESDNIFFSSILSLFVAIFLPIILALFLIRKKPKYSKELEELEDIQISSFDDGIPILKEKVKD